MVSLCYCTSCVCVCVYVTPLFISCRIDGFPWQFGEERVRGVFRDAAKIWSDVTPLTFTEVRNGHADIRIDFRRWEELLKKILKRSGANVKLHHVVNYS